MRRIHLKKPPVTVALINSLREYGQSELLFSKSVLVRDAEFYFSNVADTDLNLDTRIPQLIRG